MNQFPITAKTVSRQFVTAERLWYLVIIIVSILTAAAMLLVDPLIILGALCALVGVILLFVHPYLGVLVYLVFEYSSVAAMYPPLQALQLGKVIVIATIAAWVIRRLVARNLRFVSDRINWWFALWVLTAVFSTFVAVEQKLALQGALDILKWFAIYFMIINVVDTLPKWKGCMWLLLILAFRMSQFQLRSFAYGLAHADSSAFFIREGVGAGTTAFFGNAGDFGVFMCVTIPLAYYLYKASNSKILKAVTAMFLLFFVISIIRSGARGSVVGFVAISTVFCVRSHHKVLIALSIVSMIAVYWITAPDVVRSRFISAASENRDGTATHRLTLWNAGLKMMMSHPMTGVGVYNFNRNFLDNYATEEQKKQATAPHNLFVQCMAEMGLVGIASLLAIIGLTFMRNYQTRAILRENHRKNDWITNFALGLDLSLVGYLVSGSFLSVLYYPHLFLLLALTVSLHNVGRKRIEAGLDVFNGPTTSEVLAVGR